METQQTNIVIVAGEVSGDAHAAHLVKAMKSRDPALSFSGLGGRNMEDAGVDIFYDLTTIAVVGFWEVLKNYREFKHVFDLILTKIDEKNPACVILVDYPGFNLRLAKELKKRGIKVIYYISPQLWAWKEKRVEQIRQYVDVMLVLFKFEVDFYARHGIEAHFVGHPLVDSAKISTGAEEFLTTNHLQPGEPTIGLLPGSREKEVEALLPVMLKAAKIIREKIPLAQFLIVRASSIPESMIAQYLDDPFERVRVVGGNHYDAINACSFCMVASGTATLETALMGKPMVVTYKTSPLTYWLAKCFIKIPYIGLVNVVAGKRIVPECVQHDATPEKIADGILEIAGNELQLSETKEELRKVKESLGEPGASERAAEVILKQIK